MIRRFPAVCNECAMMSMEGEEKCCVCGSDMAQAYFFNVPAGQRPKLTDHYFLMNGILSAEELMAMVEVIGTLSGEA